MILENKLILKNEKIFLSKRLILNIHILLIFFSFVSALLIFFDSNKPYYYFSLPLLPILFCLLNLIILPFNNKLFLNLGFVFLELLMFFRLSVSPLFMMLGNYTICITLNVADNTSKAIFLIAYETIMIYGVFILFFSKEKHKSFIIKNVGNNNYIYEDNRSLHIPLLFKIILLLLSIVLVIIFIYVPGLKNLYRTIFDINKPAFTHLTSSYIINKYGTSFYKKGAMVIGIHIFKILRLLIPTTLLVSIKNKKTKISLPLSFIIIFSQFLIVDDTIARSFYYAFILFLLLNFLYPQKSRKLIIYSFIFAILSISFYFIIRYKFNNYNNLFSYLSLISNNYFSGVNITSGIFNMPRNTDLRWHYFIRDYLEAIPFGNTLFGYNYDVIQLFFNDSNGVYGQIPTTIACGYYYFGVFFAPVYSIILALLTLYGGTKIQSSKHFLDKVIWLYFTLVMSLGIIMYNISITLTTITYNLIPIFLIKMSLKGKKNDT